MVAHPRHTDQEDVAVVDPVPDLVTDVVHVQGVDPGHAQKGEITDHIPVRIAALILTAKAHMESPKVDLVPSRITVDPTPDQNKRRSGSAGEKLCCAVLGDRGGFRYPAIAEPSRACVCTCLVRSIWFPVFSLQKW